MYACVCVSKKSCVLALFPSFPLSVSLFFFSSSSSSPPPSLSLSRFLAFTIGSLWWLWSAGQDFAPYKSFDDDDDDDGLFNYLLFIKAGWRAHLDACLH